ncbi:MAG: hypothetical protein CM15mV62_630 [uncultured marine virus]|nr:MAG: hypothetical protein CM15mV62_630 [uncultured marine virus]
MICGEEYKQGWWKNEFYKILRPIEMELWDELGG